MSGNYSETSYDNVQKLRPIDDILFEVIIKDRATCEEILRVILEDENLTVISVTPQSSLRNLYGRSVRLDAYCELGNGKKVNIEVQKSNDDDHVRRVRYNEACITSNYTKTGVDFIEVPDVIMVFISAFDIFKKGRTIYHCKTFIEELKEPINNGLIEIYVNASINDGSEIAELMECFKKEQFEHEKFPVLSNRVKTIKGDEKEVLYMCEIMEEYAKKEVVEYGIASATNLLINKVAPDVIVSSLSISLDVVNELRQKLIDAGKIKA